MDNFDMCLEEALLNHKFSIDMPVSMTPSEVNIRLQTILNNHPEIFWFQGKWKLESNHTKRYVIPLYLFPIEDIAFLNSRIENIIRKMVNVKGTRMEQAREIFVLLTSWCDYGEGACGGQTIYDTFISRKAYCKGLSKGYQLLMQRLQIPCRLVSGSLWGEGRHIWNEVQIDGIWYSVDLSTAYPQIRDMMRIPSEIFCMDSSELPACYHIINTK